MTTQTARWTLFLLAFAATAAAQPPKHPDVVISAQQQSNAEVLHLTTGTLRIKPCTAGIVRVTFVTGPEIPDLSNPSLPDSACATTAFTARDADGKIEVITPEVHIEISRNTGAIHFSDTADKSLLTESDWPYPRNISPTVTDGNPTTQAGVWFALSADEHFYGLGQHQSEILNQRNLQLVLSQDNTNVSVPFFLSSNGYGVLWNSASVTNWNNRFRPVLAIQSNDAPAVDYYYFAGPSFDKIIAEYRQLTGTAPLFPRWAYGYWQSKYAYASTDEIVGVATRYRKLHIPLDNIVLDEGWETVLGGHIFTQKYPDPKAMVQSLHEQHVHLMASIWPLYQPGSANYDAMDKAGYFVTPGPDAIPPYVAGQRLYDALNPGARKLYWEQAKQALSDIGVDAYWLDSTEPLDAYGEEHAPMLAGAKTALGDGSRYANLYPLMTTTAIYEGLRAQPDHKRAFILTRSAFTGEQRNAAAVWSGDSLTTWDTFRRQIPAGLNYALTGLPYWTTDIGGFVGGDTTSPAYQELFVRWFEYGVFCPIFRAHGARQHNELWSYGPQAQEILTKYDRLRYRLMPYIYSLAARTTMEGYTPMRALAFDFPGDEKAIDLPDEFMFGPSLLVAPVTYPGATSRDVYLPKGADWYDYWTGKRVAGGQTIHRDAPIAVLPLYVRAGTILPLGPEEEYTGEHPGAPIELRIYPGTNADTKLYNDNGITYDYESAQFTWTPIHWDNASGTLSLAARQGQFDGAPAAQDFNITLVSGGESTHKIHYTTQREQITFHGPTKESVH
jgi:alpha-D-xyloside xylohydrolase